MTPEEQQIVIAEACGWKCKCGCSASIRSSSCDELPDYLNDLNAMHEVEKVLTFDQAGIYERTLAAIQLRQTGIGNCSPPRYHVTAAQRAEAFLRTKGLWKE
jgi:hypothetical protein